MLITRAESGTPARGQQPTHRHRRGDPPARHRAEPEPDRDHPRGGSDHRESVRPVAARRPRQHRIRLQRPAPPGEHRTHRLDPPTETAQPPPHRPAAHPSPAAIRRCPTPATFAASAEPITAATPARRASTPPATAHESPRSQCTSTAAERSTPDCPSRGTTGPKHDPTRPAPPNTPDTPAHPRLDPVHVCLYRDHRASERTTRPSRATPPPKNQQEGRGLRRPRHGDGANQQGLSPTQTRSARSTAPNRHYVVILSGG
jgi:hypothetical protein